MSIMIVENRQEGNGRRFVAGGFQAFPGWTFEAIVTESACPTNDCWICGSKSRVVDIQFFEGGAAYYACPGDDYDGHCPFISADLERMAQQVNALFP